MEPNQSWRSSVQDYFHRQAATYSARSERGLWASVRRHELANVRRFLALESHHRVLEVGCGSGFYAGRLMAGAAEYAAIDACGAMVDNALRAGVPAQCVSLEDFSAPRRFDRVLAAGVLEFAERPRHFMACLAGMLAPAGRLVLLTPRPGFSGLAYAAWHWWKSCPSHVFSENEFERLIAGADLEILEAANVSSISRCWSLAGRK